MYSISGIVRLKKVDYCVWHVVFQMDQQPQEYATDFLYLLKEKKWVINSLVTHELSSLMQGHSCIYCGETKIACFVASKEFELIKQGIINNRQFLSQVSADIDLKPEEISLDLHVVNNKSKWQELAEENRFYGNLLRIKKRQ
ncbi:hypothetical protein H1D32_06560 [Anaerobacillus sp. CMMVII]|uniref:hypothetical protein n=1 Tax=Anaerobacillus sp. CMMVII TaxID=2755588 RepID=UPI0021B70D5A|nr:hypothetical protein [Anaerobacillus sp. CMMVII]MCT8137435.1 hypothetical protein [Anaerobacillus sp. CMMVII]